jgi:hypothetical protein
MSKVFGHLWSRAIEMVSPTLPGFVPKTYDRPPVVMNVVLKLF